MKQTLLIIDTFHLIFRMFYALPPNLTDKEGNPTNAVFGVTKLLLSLMGEFRPDYLVMATEGQGKSFREELYPAYKSNRDGLPDDLRDQIAPIFEIAGLLNIPLISLEGHEADDVIGTLATHMKQHHPDIMVNIMSGDKDLYQFVGGNIFMYDPIEKRQKGVEATIKKFGLPPEHILDMLALVGDTSDCIPGVAGIGPKGAQKLLGEYGSLENIYEHIDDITGATQKKLIAGKESAFLSKQLATIITDMPISIDLGEFCTTHESPFDNTDVVGFLQNKGFDTLIPKDKKIVHSIDTTKFTTLPLEDFSAVPHAGIILQLSPTGTLSLSQGDTVYQGHLNDISTEKVEEILANQAHWKGFNLKQIARELILSQSIKEKQLEHVNTLF